MTTHTALIPLDGSSFSQQVVPQVGHLFDPKDYALILLRVAEPVAGLTGIPPRPISTGWTTAMYELKQDLEYASHPIYDMQMEASERDAIEQSLREEQRRLEQAGYSVSVAVRFGEAAEEIAACAAGRGVDLIAMATHSRTGLSHLVLGSVAERVLRNVSIPVLLVRPFAPDME